MAARMSSWEDFCKDARRIENEIDGKLISLTKLGTSLSLKDHNGSSSDSVPLLDSSNNEPVFESMAYDIEQMLMKLSDIVNSMTDYVQLDEHKGTSGNTLMHTLQRHRDILQYYMHDFQKTKVNVKMRKDRENLLGSVRKDIESYKNSSLVTRRSDLLMKENEHLRSSEAMVDDQISVAIDMKYHLLNQRLAFKSIQGKINNLANRFPIINSLVQRINFRKRRDSFIIALVISVCLILLLMYALH